MGTSAQGNSEAAKACQKGGFVNWTARPGGPPFASNGQCVRAGAQGTIYPAPTISIVRDGTSDIDGQQGTNILCCFFWVTYDNLMVPPVPFAYEDRYFDVTFYHNGAFESVSTYLIENGVQVGDIVPFGTTQVIVVTDRQTGEVLATGAPQVCEAAA